MLIDTHAHIHFDEFNEDLGNVFTNAKSVNIKHIITVGTEDGDSKRALEFVCAQDVLALAGGINMHATAGLHPHEANRGDDALLTIKELVMDGGYGDKLVAVGECGLDYYRNLSSKKDQFRALEFQIELALGQGLPLVFHIRDAWDDYFALLKNYKEVRGVIHSFTGGPAEVEKASDYNVYFGLNGIMTFTKNNLQLEAAKLVANNRLLLETDCPYLSPNPERGHRNEPAFMKYTAEFLAKLRGQEYRLLSRQTSDNAKTLFALK